MARGEEVMGFRLDIATETELRELKNRISALENVLIKAGILENVEVDLTTDYYFGSSYYTVKKVGKK